MVTTNRDRNGITIELHAYITGDHLSVVGVAAVRDAVSDSRYWAWVSTVHGVGTSNKSISTVKAQKTVEIMQCCAVILATANNLRYFDCFSSL